MTIVEILTLESQDGILIVGRVRSCCTECVPGGGGHLHVEHCLATVAQSNS